MKSAALTEGKANKEVAAVLRVSPYTVETHRTNLMQKLIRVFEERWQLMPDFTYRLGCLLAQAFKKTQRFIGNIFGLVGKA